MNKKPAPIKVVVTEKEKLEIRIKAAQKDMSMSAYLRMLGMKAK